MQKRKAAVFLVAALGIFLPGSSQAVNKALPQTSNLDYIDPTIGNVAPLLQPTRPTVHLPNQLIRVFPQRNDYIDDQISSFPLTIVSHRLGEVFMIKPCAGSPDLGNWKTKMTYDHDLEISRPWYSSTYLVDDGITVEFTPGKKVGYYRFEFPANTPKSILFGLYNNAEGEFRLVSSTEITGMETYHGNIKVYMYGVFNPGAASVVFKDDKLLAERTAAGKNVRAQLSFPAGKGTCLTFKYSISFISVEQAKKNFVLELKSVSFDQLKQQAQQSWGKVINQINVKGGTAAQKRSFYTALYRCYERMVNITEEGKYFSGFDNNIHTITDGRPFYVDDWTWDTYLAHHPLRAILDPAMEEDMMNSYVTMYNQSGWMPTFPVLFGDHACMNGFHSSIMFLDNYRKGLRRFDVLKAYEGMRKNGMEATMLPWKNGPKTSLDEFYLTKGYFPALQVGETESNQAVSTFEKRQSVAVTMGGSYDDWAVGEMAKELGNQDDWKIFNTRSGNFKHLWNDSMQMFIPKDDKGSWVLIDPKFDGGMGGRDYYDENNGWTYLWQVQHNVKALVQLMGGKDRFEKKLDQLFREGLDRSKYQFWAKFPDATSLTGQYSMGNEPSFHIPYLYNFTDSPWKTQKRIRFLLNVWFKDNIFGIPGDEDGGGMSAFVVFSSMGFYPVTPGLPVYTIGSPLFKEVSINLPGGKKFQLTAKNCSVTNKYIQSAKINGKPLLIPWFTHQQLIAGCKLELVMGPKPNKNWGKESLYSKANKN